MALGTQRIARPVSSEDALWQGMGGHIRIATTIQSIFPWFFFEVAVAFNILQHGILHIRKPDTSRAFIHQQIV